MVRCATVAHGTTQPIRVETDPPGAVVSLNCAHGSLTNVGTTPVIVQVQRKSKSCAIGVAKEGYFPANVPLHRSLSGTYVGNLLLGGVVGFVADAADGAMYKQGPAVVRVDLVSVSREPVTTIPAPEGETHSAPEMETHRQMLKDRDGRDAVWVADESNEVASCTQVGKYDTDETAWEGTAAVADRVLRAGGDTLFNPDGGTVFDIYRCGSAPGVAQRTP